MKKLILKYILITLLAIMVVDSLFSQSILINEVMYSNKDILFDEENNTPDWIEIYNTGEQNINLKGYQLTDDTTETTHWTFPDLELAPKDFLIVFASGKNKKEGELHTDFRLGVMKEPVVLISPQGEVLSYFEIQCVPQNLSLGYIVDGKGEPVVQKPSPGKSNEASEIIKINYQPDELHFSKGSGFYTDEFELVLSNNNSNNLIKFTTDGTAPDLESASYSRPILVKDRTPEENIYANIRTSIKWQKPGNNIFKATPVRAIAYSEGCPASDEIICTYFVHPAIKKKYKVPVVSLVTDPDNLFDDETGIYVDGDHQNSLQHGKDWEREAHIEFWESADNKTISQNIGIRIHGRGSRKAPKKSLRLYAHKKYGKASFEYPFFNDKKHLSSFKTLLLRSSVDETGTLFIDEMAHQLVSGMDIDYQAGKTVVVFINGEYWGLHSLRERQDEDYIRNNHNLEAENYDIISYEPTRGPEVAEGTIDTYDQLIQYLETHDLTKQQYYDEACELVDVSNLMDYFIAQLYFANIDFPNNNQKLWRAIDSEGKWRTFFFDCDMCMIRSKYDHLTEYLTDYDKLIRFQEWSTIIFKSFMKNETFRNKFALKYYKELNSTFSPNKIIEKINEYEKLYEPLIAEHTYRWHEPVDIVKWRKNVDALRIFALQRPVVVNEQLNKFIENPFRIFPNPTQSGFYLANSINNDIELETQVFSMDGKIAYSKNQKLSAKSKSYIDPSLKKGFYLVKIKYGDYSFISKLVKQ